MLYSSKWNQWAFWNEANLIFRILKFFNSTHTAYHLLDITKYNIENNLKITLNGNNQILSQSINKKQQPDIGLGRLRWDNKEDIQQWLTWNTNTDKQQSSYCCNYYDVIVASEVAYEHNSIIKLLNTIKLLLNPESGIAIIRGTPEITDDAQGFEYVLSYKR